MPCSLIIKPPRVGVVRIHKVLPFRRAACKPTQRATGESRKNVHLDPTSRENAAQRSTSCLGAVTAQARSKSSCIYGQLKICRSPHLNGDQEGCSCAPYKAHNRVTCPVEACQPFLVQLPINEGTHSRRNIPLDPPGLPPSKGERLARASRGGCAGPVPWSCLYNDALTKSWGSPNSPFEGGSRGMFLIGSTNREVYPYLR
jgi:hypothetical protein